MVPSVERTNAGRHAGAAYRVYMQPDYFLQVSSICVNVSKISHGFKSPQASKQLGHFVASVLLPKAARKLDLK